MNKIILPSILIIFFMFMFSCSSVKKKEAKILVIGDVQLKSDIRRYIEEEWIIQKLDTTQFSYLFNDVLKRESPDFILQTGDWVNYNNNLFLEIIDTLGNNLKLLSLPYDEWGFMNAHIPKELKENFYMAQGNHESYKKIVLQGIYIPKADILANIKESEFTLFKSKEKKELLISRFPHLKNAVFHKNTGTYVVNNDLFTLLSFDGLDKERKGLLSFLEFHLKEHQKVNLEKPLFVISHYPIFTGRIQEEDSQLALRDIRDSLIHLFNKYKVDLYMNGHEHFYLRYKKMGLEKAGFSDSKPKHTKYMTISNFGNPYAREFKRLKAHEYDNNSVVYFNGIHYTTIQIIGSKIIVKTYGLNPLDKNWKPIDEFEMELSNP